MTVNIKPMADWTRKTQFRPLHPPVFPDGEPTQAEVQLALALFAELDDESKTWYGGARFEASLRDRLAK